MVNKPSEEVIDISRSMDMDLKYKIHHALVMQQNSHNKQRPQSLQRDILVLPKKQLNYQSFVSDGENFHSASLPQMHQVRVQSQQFRSSNPVLKPHYFVKNVAQKLKKQELRYDPTNPKNLIDQLISHSKNLQIPSNPDYNHHFIASLKANAHDVLNPDSFTGLTDYIQYGLASRCNQLLFQRLFKTKAMSVLFSKWRSRYQGRRYKGSLKKIHAAHVARQVLIEWTRVVQQKKLWVKEFQRTKTIQRIYGVFQRWSRANREMIKGERKQVLVFKKKIVLKAWLKYLNRQGSELISIIKAQSYHRQSLMSRALVGLYQHHLQQIRARNFLIHQVFTKFFKKQWKPKYKKNFLLKKLISKLQSRKEVSDRMKYQREYEAKGEVMADWKLKTQEKKECIKLLSALTHYRQTLIIKTFFNLKKMCQASLGLRKLSSLLMRSSIKPSFEKIQIASDKLLSSETQFRRYRQNFKLATLFVAWKEISIRSKLAKLFYKKLVLKHLYTYVHHRNNILPAQYRARRLQALFMSQLTHEVRVHWRERRSDIILRQLKQKKQERLMRVSYLRLLENVMNNRKHRLIGETSRQFRAQKLCDKVMRILKRRWLKRKRDSLMMQVADDFSLHREYKKQEVLKESLLSSTNDFEIVRLREHQVFDDPIKMLKYRVLSTWKMYIFDRLRRDTVLDRYLLFRCRMLRLRCFLGWRSIAKYEQSSGGQMSGTQVSFKRKNKMPSVSDNVTREHSPQKSYQNNRGSVDAGGSISVRGDKIDARQYLFDNRIRQRSQQESIGGAASATFGMRSNGSNYESINEKRLPLLIDGDTPRDCYLRSTSILKEDKPFNGTQSLFDELESIFQKNRKWLDEQREREEFLREMASQYNQQLSLEVNSLRQSREQLYPSITTSIASRR